MDYSVCYWWTIPEELTGLYTAERYAVADIERYLEK